MRLLLEIDDKLLGNADNQSYHSDRYTERSTARAVIFNEKNQIAILHAEGYGYHLPGGGIEPDEDWSQALLREAKEEIGCILKLRMLEVGKIIEYRSCPTIGNVSGYRLKQVSYCGVADVVGYTDVNHTINEKSVFLAAEWHYFSDALKIFQEQILNKKASDRYEAAFVKVRDCTFLDEAKKLLKA